METWTQMTARHKAERRAMVESLAAERLTQTQAARKLKTTVTCLNNYIQRNRIHWPVVKMGVRQ
jgi:transcriptional regulator with GAF, ATPase, and Fis domain